MFLSVITCVKLASTAINLVLIYNVFGCLPAISQVKLSIGREPALEAFRYVEDRERIRMRKSEPKSPVWPQLQLIWSQLRMHKASREKTIKKWMFAACTMHFCTISLIFSIHRSWCVLETAPCSLIDHRTADQIVHCPLPYLLQDGSLKTVISPVQTEIGARCSISSPIGMINFGLHWPISCHTFEVRSRMPCIDPRYHACLFLMCPVIALACFGMEWFWKLLAAPDRVCQCFLANPEVVCLCSRQVKELHLGLLIRLNQVNHEFPFWYKLSSYEIYYVICYSLLYIISIN